MSRVPVAFSFDSPKRNQLSASLTSYITNIAKSTVYLLYVRPSSHVLIHKLTIAFWEVGGGRFISELINESYNDFARTEAILWMKADSSQINWFHFFKKLTLKEAGLLMLSPPSLSTCMHPSDFRVVAACRQRQLFLLGSIKKRKARGWGT